MWLRSLDQAARTIAWDWSGLRWRTAEKPSPSSNGSMPCWTTPPSTSLPSLCRINLGPGRPGDYPPVMLVVFEALISVYGEPDI